LIQKKQKIKSAKMLLCRTGLALQNGQNHGLESFALLSFAHAPGFCKISNAPTARKPHRSARFRPKLLC
jgi:hypothetical protein